MFLSGQQFYFDKFRTKPDIHTQPLCFFMVFLIPEISNLTLGGVSLSMALVAPTVPTERDFQLVVSPQRL